MYNNLFKLMHFRIVVELAMNSFYLFTLAEGPCDVLRGEASCQGYN